MNLTEYERIGQRLYADFSEAIASILKVALATKPDLQLQEVQFRAKDPASLSRKLENRQMSACPDIAEEIKDLAGCRLIFYTNTDVEAFAQSRILHDNFDVDYDRTKIHYPTGDGDDANALFISDNYVIRLKQNRADLPEYARFADLRCEVQVQTILNHAWAQMAHDTIYKKPIEKGFGTAFGRGYPSPLEFARRHPVDGQPRSISKVIRPVPTLIAFWRSSPRSCASRYRPRADRRAQAPAHPVRQ